jgi:3-deoxy-D-manno-octulosonate 8-phosphate phosphatase (KDO 8-P phosphatase)
LEEAGPDVSARASKVKLVLLDSDGVLTDGRIIMSSDGDDVRAFDVRDGHGIRMGQQAGLLFGVISGRESRALAERAAELQFDEVHQRVLDKLGRAKEILDRRDLAFESTCFMGDDLIDLRVMRRCGFAVAPADAVPEVREAAHYVTARAGGRGAVREVIDLVLRANGKWDDVTARYLSED